MRRLRAFASAFAMACGLAACGSMPASAPAPTAAPDDETVLPMTLVDNRVFVDVRVDGQGPFAFLLDTGSGESIVSPALASSLRLPPTSTGSGSGAGEQRVSWDVVHVSSLTAGSWSLGPADLPAIDMSVLNRVIGFPRFDGVLGAEIFHGHVVTIDVARSQVSLVPTSRFVPPAGAVAVPFTLDEEEMPTITASVAGLAGLFEVDTGDRSSLTLFGPFWREHGLDRVITPNVTAMTGYGVGGPILGIVGRPANFTMQGLAVARPVTRLSLQKAGGFAKATRAGSIGMGILKRFTVSFDYAHHTMWLTRGPRSDAPDPYDRSGLWLGLPTGGGEVLEVVAVTPGSPAAGAGLQAGDAVTRVDGVTAGPGTLFEIRQRLQSPGDAAVEVHGTRQGKPYEARFALKDLIGAP
jgi:hypothetical protein